MYRIFADGRTLEICENPTYIKQKGDLWVTCDKDEAGAISVNGIPYTDAVAAEVDGGRLLYNLFKDLAENMVTTNDLQDALCELSEDIEGLVNGGAN